MSESLPRDVSSPPADVAELMARVRDRVAQRRAASSPNGKVAAATATEPDTNDEIVAALAGQADFNAKATAALVAMERTIDGLRREASELRTRLARSEQAQRALQKKLDAQSADEHVGKNGATSHMAQPMAKPARSRTTGSSRGNGRP